MLTLQQLKHYFIANQNASLATLSQQFAEEPVFIQQMLEHFIKKGCLIERRLTKQCGSVCQKCPVNETIVYQWHLS